MSDCSKCYYCRSDFGSGWSGPRCALGRNLYTENTDNCKLYLKNDRKHKLEMLAEALHKWRKISTETELFNPFCMVANVFPQSEIKEMSEETIDLLLRFAEETSYKIRRYQSEVLPIDEIVRLEKSDE